MEEEIDGTLPTHTREQARDLLRQRRYLRHHLTAAIEALMNLNELPHEQDDIVYIDAVKQLEKYLSQLERREL